MKNFFAEARAYRDAIAADEEVRTDSRYAAMVSVLDGKIPVVVAADGAAQINDAVTWALEEDIEVVIRGGADAIHVADRRRRVVTMRVTTELIQCQLDCTRQECDSRSRAVRVHSIPTASLGRLASRWHLDFRRMRRSRR